MMDDKDAKIIEILRENARTKNTEIAVMIGLTEGAVRARITNLVRSGTIRKFTVETESIGVEGIILVVIDVAKAKDVILRLKHIGNKVFETSGEFDAAILVTTSDVDSLNSLVDEIRAIEGIQSTSTLIRLA